jgi:hypothetical protein
MVEHHLVKVSGGSSSLLFSACFCASLVELGRHSSLKICILPVRVRQGVFLSLLVSPDDGMVDVPDLGSGFWEFKSPSGQFAHLVKR